MSSFGIMDRRSRSGSGSCRAALELGVRVFERRPRYVYIPHEWREKGTLGGSAGATTEFLLKENHTHIIRLGWVPARVTNFAHGAAPFRNSRSKRATPT